MEGRIESVEAKTELLFVWNVVVVDEVNKINDEIVATINRPFWLANTVITGWISIYYINIM
jgi:hypothetical protein